MDQVCYDSVEVQVSDFGIYLRFISNSGKIQETLFEAELDDEAASSLVEKLAIACHMSKNRVDLKKNLSLN